MISALCWIPRGLLTTPDAPSAGAPLDATEVRELVTEMRDAGSANHARNCQSFRRMIKASEKTSKKGKKKKSSSEGDSDDDSSDNDVDFEDKLEAGDFPGSQFFTALDSDLPNVLNDPFLKKDAEVLSELLHKYF